jgi:hypothetical protein
MSLSPFDNLYGRDRPVRVRGCDCPGCIAPGDYRAPRDRSLRGYYFFCLDHVREYNRNWDYFSGMTGGEIEHYTRSASVWERPSWPLGQWRIREQKLRDDVMSEFFADEAPPTSSPSIPKAERDALSELELRPPASFVAIKAQYRALVKRHHPDANGGSRDAEEKFKSINQAFAMLKQIYCEDVA